MEEGRRKEEMEVRGRKKTGRRKGRGMREKGTDIGKKGRSS